MKKDLVSISLSAAERMVLLGTVLPAEGTITTARLVRALREKLALTAEEEKRLGVKLEGDILRFSTTKDRPRSFGFGGFEIELIVSRLRRLDKEEKLTEQHVSLWEKFDCAEKG